MPAAEELAAASGAGVPFAAPAARSLRSRLDLARALRPLMRKVQSRIRSVLDEEATATRIAESYASADRGWVPVVRPDRERWLDVDLVVEDFSAVALWEKAIAELQHLLEYQGAFRSVRTWRLEEIQHEAETTQNPRLALFAGWQRRGTRPRPAKELLDPTGRRLILLASDCSSPLWRRQEIYRLLRRCAKVQPVTIVQLLPGRLWSQSLLGYGFSVRLRSQLPGVANDGLLVGGFSFLEAALLVEEDDSDINEDGNWGEGWDEAQIVARFQRSLLKLPVLTLNPDAFKPWARMVAGCSDTQTPGVIFDGRFGSQRSLPVPTETMLAESLEPEDRVNRFHTTASLTARKLGGLMAAMPVSVPVIDLVRKELLPQSKPEHVAEVLASELIVPLLERSKDGRRCYDFAPGTRQLMLDAVREPDAETVLDVVSCYVAKKAGVAIESFASLLSPMMEWPEGVRGEVLPFARIAREVLQRMGGEYAALLENLHLQPPPRTRPGYAPPLLERRFQVATIEFVAPKEEKNPFVCGPPVAPGIFYGREDVRELIRNCLGARSPQSINPIGLRRSGKSSLLRLVREKPEEFFRTQQKPLVVCLDLQNRAFQTPKGLQEGLRRGITKELGAEPWKREENDDPFAVEDGLQNVKERGWRLVVQLDEFECIGERLADFQEWGHDWRSKASAELITLMVASKRPIHEIWRTLGLTSDFSNIFRTTVLGSLERGAWEQLVRDGLPDVSEVELAAINALAGGMPCYVQVAASCLWETGNIAAMRQEFQSQMRGVWRNLWESLSVREQQVVQAAVAGRKPLLQSRIVLDLQQYGVLRSDGMLFSKAFASWLKDIGVAASAAAEAATPRQDGMELFSAEAATPSQDGMELFSFETAAIENIETVVTRPGLFGIGRKTEQRVRVRHRQLQGWQWIEGLGNEVLLAMVLVPAGTFVMGSPGSELERSDNEGPQHEANVSHFLMGKYPVTQEQWRIVAALPRVALDLNLDPSHFKGGKRPVENVSWHDAVEFCQRLSRRAGKTYRLPSEAEWEYACRAGTTTPFHFGETIVTDLANYDGTDTKDERTDRKGSYGRGPTGVFRGETTEVGSFPSNAFGLYDMHGNVWEWCADEWHDNYEGAPTDGSAWTDIRDIDRSKFRVLRGGPWLNIPIYCRSACRFSHSPNSRYNFYGFRVCCSSTDSMRN